MLSISTASPRQAKLRRSIQVALLAALLFLVALFSLVLRIASSSRALRDPAPAAGAAAATTSTSAALPKRQAWASDLIAAMEHSQDNKISFQRFTVEGVSFLFAVQDTLHSADYVIRYEMNNVFFWGKGIKKALARKEDCYVADVGSNGGFYSLLSRTLGCRALSVDAQPRCLQRLASAAAVNGFSEGITTAWTAVGKEGSEPITVGATKCSGLWSVTPDNAELNAKSESNATVGFTALSRLLDGDGVSPGFLPPGEKLTNLKIDAEGSEIAVLRSGIQLFKERRVGLVLMELVPSRVLKISSVDEVAETFTAMYDAGYRCFTLERTDGANWKPLDRMIGIFQHVASDGRQQPFTEWGCHLPEPGSAAAAGAVA